MNELLLRGVAIFLAMASLQVASAKERDAPAFTLARLVQVPANFDECQAAAMPLSDLAKEHRIQFTIAKDGSTGDASFPDGSTESAQVILKCAFARLRFAPPTREEEPIATHAFLYFRIRPAGPEFPAGAGIEKVGPLITPPALKRYKSTDSCFPRWKVGNVSRFVVTLTVSPDGAVTDLKMPLGSESWHEETTRCVLSRVSFAPGSRDGMPVEAQAALPIFMMNDGESTEPSALSSSNEEVEAAYRACYPDDLLTMTSAFYSFDIATSGRLQNAKVAKSSGDPRIDAVGICMLELLRFKPMMQNGHPVRSSATWELPIRPPRQGTR